MSSVIQQPSRRTLAKGAAWSVPIIALGGPAMAATVSPTLIPTITTTCSNNLLAPSTLVFTIKAGSGGLPAGTTFTFTYSKSFAGTTPSFISSPAFGVNAAINGNSASGGSGVISLGNALSANGTATISVSITPALMPPYTVATLSGEGATVSKTFGAAGC